MASRHLPHLERAKRSLPASYLAFLQIFLNLIFLGEGGKGLLTLGYHVTCNENVNRETHAHRSEKKLIKINGKEKINRQKIIKY